MENQIQPSIGRIVHFVQNGVVSPAMITKVWTRECVNLQVLPDCAAPFVATSVMYQMAGSSQSWGWPERV